MTLPDPQRRRVLRQTGATLTAIGTAGLATTTASAQTDGGSQQGILADGVGDGGDLMAFVRGFTSRFSNGYGAPESAETLADRMRNEFNANSGAWIDYGNWLVENHDVSPAGTTIVGVDVAITRSRWPTRDGSVSTTIDAQYDETDRFTDLEWRLGAPDEPDYEATITNKAAENAADELQEFRREYIATEDGDEHTLPDTEYLSELMGRYSTSITFGEDSKNVLELFLGGEF